MSETSQGVLLVVDDEPLKRITLQIELSQAGYAVHEAAEADLALRVLESRPVDVVITDLRMPQTDGIQLLDQIKKRWPQTHVLLMTAYGSVDSAVAAIKRGAYDYLTKPFKTADLLEKLDYLKASRSFVTHAGTAHNNIEQLGTMIGRSYASRRMFKRLRAVAGNEGPVLIQGEPGTGKSCSAEAIHQLSLRNTRRMITFDAGQSDATAEPELLSCLERADGSTMFIRRVDKLAPQLQARLAYLLEHQSFQRPGNLQTVPVDVRLLCATCRDLQPLVESGLFRQDLYYRLSAMALSVPPLRDRREDIPALIDHLMRQSAATAGPINRPSSPQTAGAAKPAAFSPEAIEVLLNYDWPGNVREFARVIQRAAASAVGTRIEAGDIALPQKDTPPITMPAFVGRSDRVLALTETIAGIERSLIDTALQRASGNQARAAQFLGIPRTTLRDKMAKHGMTGDAGKRMPSA